MEALAPGTRQICRYKHRRAGLIGQYDCDVGLESCRNRRLYAIQLSARKSD